MTLSALRLQSASGLCEAMPPQAAGFAPTTEVVSPAGQSFEKDSLHPV